MAYRARIVDDQLAWLVENTAAVMVRGARGVGKTTTASRHAATVVNLENDDTLAAVQADSELILRHDRPVLVDEWKRHPACLNVVKGAVDQDRSPGQFIFTGTPSHPRAPNVHTGAGRFTLLHMRPLTLAERSGVAPVVSLADLMAGRTDGLNASCDLTQHDYASLLLASGLPNIGDQPDDVRLALIEGYLELLVERDIAEVVNGRAVRVPPGALLRWLRAYSEAIATDASFATISRHAKAQEGETLGKETLAFYRGVLEDLGVVDAMFAWEPPLAPLANCKTAERHHLVDPALAAHLLGLTDVPQLLGDTKHGIGPQNRERTIFGAFFESMIAQSVRVYAEANGFRCFWLGTTKAGGTSEQREVDLVVMGRNRKVVGIEVKSSTEVDDHDVRHLRWLRNEVGLRWAAGAVVYAGADAYRRDDGIAVIPAALLGP